MKRHTNIIIIGILTLLAAISIFYLVIAKSPKAAVEEYITAMQKRDFGALYEMNSEAQRKVLLILRETTEKTEELLKANYLAEKQAFEKAVPSADISLQWSEKFLFIPADMKYSIIKVEEEIEKAPSAFFRARKLANVYVKIDYTNEATAPVLQEAGQEPKKIKNATYQIKMIQREEIIKGIRFGKIKRGWIFKGLTVVEATLF
jgi:hypothetical protein